MRILIVEDNLDIQANIAEYMNADYSLDFAYNGEQGLELALENEYDVIVLDLMLPGRDGLDVCRTYRKAVGLQAPIIMLTARDTIDDIEAGFAVGADDYLIKPFSLRELKVRINALGRRPKARGGDALIYAGLRFDAESLVLRKGNRSVTLLEKEAKILTLLMEAAPDIVTSDSISYSLWGEDPPMSGALRTHIYNLRKALMAVDANTALKTVRGRGYTLGVES
jgi:DNA-binding response OmpR family regulator